MHIPELPDPKGTVFRIKNPNGGQPFMGPQIIRLSGKIDIPEEIMINEATAEKWERKRKDQALKWWCKITRSPKLRK